MQTPDLTIGGFVTVSARRYPDRVALKLADGPSRTYAELDERTNRLANALRAHFRPGEQVSAWLDDSLEFVELFLAVAKAGLVLLPISTRYTAREAAELLDRSDARALCFSARLADKVEPLPGAGDLLLITLGEERVLGAARFEDFLATGSSSPLPAPDPDSPLIIGRSSGTTGVPKGVALTHRSVTNAARMNAVTWDLPAGSVCAFSGSVAFVATVTATIPAHFLLGGCVVMIGQWSVERLLGIIECEAATYSWLPTPRVAEFAAAVTERPASIASLRTLVHGGSKAAPAHIASLHAVVGERLIEGWGMTESSGGMVASTTRADMAGRSEAADPFASVGRPTVDCAVEVVDLSGQPLRHDGSTVGELVIKTPSLMAGYWGDPDATRAAMHEGWYRTGDLGSIDPAGYVYISDRRTDLIVSGGMNVYPSEVEIAIAEHPDVKDVAVFGAPDERWGTTVAAAVVARSGSALTADDIVTHCRERIAGYKKPTRVIFVDALPTNESDKVLRRVLRDTYYPPQLAVGNCRGSR